MTFPEITHIDQVLPYIQGRSDFAIKDQGEYISIDYIFAGEDTFDHPIRRECRGLKFLKSGELLARPYHKFFNLGEKEETQPHTIDWSDFHIVYEKLDGSMVHPAEINGEIVFMTRAGITSISEDAAKFAKDNGYIDKCRELLRGGWTPIFEWCSPRNQIVVRYIKDRLVLTAMRNNLTGAYAMGMVDDFPHIVKLFERNAGRVGDIKDFIAHTRDEEGYVIRFKNGLMIKMKADAYVLRHKARDSITLEKNVLRIVLERHG